MRVRPAALLAVLIACSRAPGGGGESARSGAAAPRPTPFEWNRPAGALELDADEVAHRLGSFEWTGAIEWTVSREGDDARRVRALERHRVRQSASGEFEAAAEIDPGLGPGSDTGKEIVYAGGVTYARARHAPFRERPTDHGRDARRFRDESFLAPLSIARLLGSALELRPAGTAEALRRPARQFTVALAKVAAPGAAAAPDRGGATAGTRAVDDDTARRRDFLRGLVPQTASGELLLDAQSGAPLRVHIAATFAVAGDPSARVAVELLAQVTARGGEVGTIAAPKGALPDERKAAGVAAALDAAGLKRQGDKTEDTKRRAEPADDTGEE